MLTAISNPEGDNRYGASQENSPTLHRGQARWWTQKKKETVALRQGEKKEEVVSLQAVEHHGKMWHHVEHSQDGKEEVNKIKRKWWEIK